MYAGRQVIGTSVENRRRPAHCALKDAPAANARPETRLTGMVGNGRTNHQTDVRWMKEALQHLGRYCDGPEPHGYIDRELHDAIHAYQRDCGLRCDGWLRPGGETENTLRIELIRLGKK
jgi:hypothetical protein